MSEAEALLKSLAEDIPTHEHPVVDTDSHFVIDPDTREITNSARRQYIMQGDHNSEVYTFELPRYIDSHDMMLCNQIKVHFINVSSDEQNQYADVADTSPLQTKEDDENVVFCSWTIDRRATQYVGILSFAIEYLCTTDSGEVVYEWNTDVYSDVEVKDSLDHDEQAIFEYSNILEQWRAQLFGAGDSVIEDINTLSAEQKTAIQQAGATQVEAITNKGTEQVQILEDTGAAQKESIELKVEEALKTIPEDYTTTYNMAEEALRKKANAVELESEGDYIFVNDSSDAPLLDLNVYGRTTQFTTTGAQLFNPYAEQNTSFGNAVVENDGAKITVTGNYYVSWPINLKAGVTYYVDFSVSGDTEYRAIRFEYPDKEITNTITNPASFTPTKDTVSVYLYAGLGTEGTVIYENVQICEGTSAKPYEPYTGGKPSPNPEYPQALESVENPTVDIYGSNLLNYDLWKNAAFHGGEGIYVDGGVIITSGDNGDAYTSYSTSHSRIRCIPGVKYVLSWEHSGAVGIVYIFPRANTAGMVSVNTSQSSYLEYTPPEGVDYFTFRVGSTPANATAVYKNIRVNVAEVRDYEPYKAPQTHTILHTLPGIPVSEGGNYTDPDGQQWICDEIDFERGVYVQRVMEKIFDGTEGWKVSQYQADNTTTRYDYTCSTYPAPLVSNCLSTHYAYDGIARKGMWVNSDQVKWVEFRIQWAYDTVDDLTAFLSDQYTAGNPVKCVYVLATPVETPLAEEEMTYYKRLKTNYPSTTVLNDSGARMTVKYAADLEKYFHNTRVISDEKITSDVDAWLTAHFTSAEGVSF